MDVYDFKSKYYTTVLNLFLLLLTIVYILYVMVLTFGRQLSQIKFLVLFLFFTFFKNHLI